MFKVVIAEDEMFVRLGLKNSINWGNFNMKVIADVSDGYAAWQVYEKEAPELIITDLKMPLMDGMTLIAKIREKEQKTKIIVLTCLEEFELVTRAISLGVSGYISKFSMREDDMESILGKVRDELERSAQPAAPPAVKEADRDAIKERLWKDYIFCDLYTAGEFGRYVKELGLNLKSSCLAVCIMEIDNYGILKEIFRDEQGHLIKLSVMNLLNEILASLCRGEVFNETNERYVLVLSFEEDRNQEEISLLEIQLMTKIKEAVELYFSTVVTFGASRVGRGYEALKEMYKEASRALAHKFLLSASQFYFTNAEWDATELVDKMKQLLSMVGENAPLDKSFAEEFLARARCAADNIQHIKPRCIEMARELMQQAVLSMHARPGLYHSISIKCSHAIEQCSTIDEIADIFKDFFVEANKAAAIDRVASREIKEAVKYIENNYDRDISLGMVADQVNLSPAYLSSLFKKEMKLNFTDYLLTFRIEKAKELLLGTYLRAYEIAQKTGFNDDTYFSRAFKKGTGESPSEYRKRRLKGWSGEWDENGI